MRQESQGQVYPSFWPHFSGIAWEMPRSKFFDLFVFAPKETGGRGGGGGEGGGGDSVTERLANFVIKDRGPIKEGMCVSLSPTPFLNTDQTSGRIKGSPLLTTAIQSRLHERQPCLSLPIPMQPTSPSPPLPPHSRLRQHRHLPHACSPSTRGPPEVEPVPPAADHPPPPRPSFRVSFPLCAAAVMRANRRRERREEGRIPLNSTY
jgi:hypothetical protein